VGHAVCTQRFPGQFLWSKLVLNSVTSTFTGSHFGDAIFYAISYDIGSQGSRVGHVMCISESVHNGSEVDGNGIEIATW